MRTGKLFGFVLVVVCAMTASAQQIVRINDDRMIILSDDSRLKIDFAAPNDCGDVPVIFDGWIKGFIPLPDNIEDMLISISQHEVAEHEHEFRVVSEGVRITIPIPPELYYPMYSIEMACGKPGGCVFENRCCNADFTDCGDWGTVNIPEGETKVLNCGQPGRDDGMELRYPP